MLALRPLALVTPALIGSPSRSRRNRRAIRAFSF
jgi:hypothetical protein